MAKILDMRNRHGKHWQNVFVFISTFWKKIKIKLYIRKLITLLISVKYTTTESPNKQTYFI